MSQTRRHAFIQWTSRKTINCRFTTPLFGGPNGDFIVGRLGSFLTACRQRARRLNVDSARTRIERARAPGRVLVRDLFSKKRVLVQPFQNKLISLLRVIVRVAALKFQILSLWMDHVTVSSWIDHVIVLLSFIKCLFNISFFPGSQSSLHFLTSALNPANLRRTFEQTQTTRCKHGIWNPTPRHASLNTRTAAGSRRPPPGLSSL